MNNFFFSSWEKKKWGWKIQLYTNYDSDDGDSGDDNDGGGCSSGIV